MLINRFVFESGIAKIEEIQSGKTIVEQPGKPGPEGLTPWDSAEQAEAWMENVYGYLLQNEADDAPTESANSEPTNTEEGTGE